MIAFHNGDGKPIRLETDAPAIKHLLTVLNGLSRREDVAAVVDGDLTITSGNDRTHKIDSKHYRDMAIDVRIWNIDADKREWLRAELEACLNEPFEGRVFRVLNEGDHYHLQVAFGMTFPPRDMYA